MTLNVVCCISNPCAYKRRYDLARAFFQRMRANALVRLFVVELCYGTQEFQVTSATDPTHLQVRANCPDILWHKENLINMGVTRAAPQRLAELRVGTWSSWSRTGRRRRSASCAPTT